MKHTVEDRGTALVAAFEGDIDLETSPAVRKVLLDCVGRSETVLVDLGGVGYIDSSGVAALVESLQTARKGGRRFLLAGISEGTRRVLELARLDKVFAIYDSVDVALASK